MQSHLHFFSVKSPKGPLSLSQSTRPAPFPPPTQWELVKIEAMRCQKIKLSTWTLCHDLLRSSFKRVTKFVPIAMISESAPLTLAQDSSRKTESKKLLRQRECLRYHSVSISELLSFWLLSDLPATTVRDFSRQVWFRIVVGTIGSIGSCSPNRSVKISITFSRMSKTGEHELDLRAHFFVHSDWNHSDWGFCLHVSQKHKVSQ